MFRQITSKKTTFWQFFFTRIYHKTNASCRATVIAPWCFMTNKSKWICEKLLEGNWNLYIILTGKNILNFKVAFRDDEIFKLFCYGCLRWRVDRGDGGYWFRNKKKVKTLCKLVLFSKSHWSVTIISHFLQTFVEK